MCQFAQIIDILSYIMARYYLTHVLIYYSDILICNNFSFTQHYHFVVMPHQYETFVLNKVIKKCVLSAQKTISVIIPQMLPWL